VAVDLGEKEQRIVVGLQKILCFISDESHNDPFVSKLFEEFKTYRLPEIT
jgi:hypothetical protein